MLDILNIIKSRDAVTKPEIVKITGLTSGTVHNLVNELLSRGIVLEGDFTFSNGGRKALKYKFNFEIYYIIGVVVSDNDISASVLDFNLNKICESDVVFDLCNHSVEEGLETIISVINSVIKKSKMDNKKFLGIGIAVPGPVNFKRGRVYQITGALKWKNVPLAEIVESRVHIDTIVDKDNNSIVSYFKMKDRSKNNKNLVYFATYAGIGAGLLINGMVYRGKQGLSGEFGHIRVAPSGERCKCGKIGCIEPLASDPSIIHFARKRIEEGAETILTQLCNNVLDDINLDMLIEAAKKQDALVRELLMNTGYYLAVCLSDIIRIYDPEEIVFDCRWLREFNDIFNYIMDKVYEDNEFVSRDELKIYLPREDEIILKGAASLIIERHLMSLESSKLI
jgi:predicted NBD/HSP70 family sugar kinase